MVQNQSQDYQSQNLRANYDSNQLKSDFGGGLKSDEDLEIAFEVEC
jgi:hypothetical protein